MKTAALLSFLAGSAVAFAPSQSTVRPATVLAASFDTDVGRANEKLGMWDPLNLVAGKQENFDRLRAAEVKNGRVAMMGECVECGAVVECCVKTFCVVVTNERCFRP